MENRSELTFSIPNKRNGFMSKFAAPAFLAMVSACQSYSDISKVSTNEQVKNEAESMKSSFNAVGVDLDIVISKKRDDLSPFARSSRRDNFAVIPQRYVDDPYFSIGLLESMFHEASHLLLNDLEGSFATRGSKENSSRSNGSVQVVSDLKEAYTRLRGVISIEDFEGEDPLLQPFLKLQNLEGSLFRVFDESNYANRVERGNEYSASLYGHPYDSHGELFASGATVMRYYPESFLADFQEVMNSEVYTEKEKMAVANVARSIVHTIEYVGQGDKEKMERLVPDFQNIKDVVFRGSVEG